MPQAPPTYLPTNHVASATYLLLVMPHHHVAGVPKATRIMPQAPPNVIVVILFLMLSNLGVVDSDFNLYSGFDGN